MSADMTTLRNALARLVEVCDEAPPEVRAARPPWPDECDATLTAAIDELEELRQGCALEVRRALEMEIVELQAQRDELRTALVACRDYLASTREVPEELVEWCMADAALANTRGGQ